MIRRAILSTVASLLLASAALAQGTAPVAPPAPPPPGRTVEQASVTASLVVKVPQVDPASDALVARCRELGGYFATRSSSRVDLRVPVEQVDALIAAAEPLGTVVERNLQRKNRTPEIVDLSARLAAREQMLSRYLEVLQGASAEAIVEVERETAQLVSEVERMKGQLRYLEHQVALAQVSVSFQFRERNAPTRDGSSSFAWLNAMNLQDLLDDFRSTRSWTRARRVDVTLPEGFAAYRQRRADRAASPDDVLFRVRTTRHKPRADLAFWKEALKNRMTDAGYRVVAEQDLAGAAQGTLLELMAPMGTEDWSYIVAVFPAGRRLVIVEAAGEASKFAPRRAAVLEAVEATRP